MPSLKWPDGPKAWRPLTVAPSARRERTGRTVLRHDSSVLTAIASDTSLENTFSRLRRYCFALFDGCQDVKNA
jgi:hypothetical protein